MTGWRLWRRWEAPNATITVPPGSRGRADGSSYWTRPPPCSVLGHPRSSQCCSEIWGVRGSFLPLLTSSSSYPGHCRLRLPASVLPPHANPSSWTPQSQSPNTTETKLPLLLGGVHSCPGEPCPSFSLGLASLQQEHLLLAAPLHHTVLDLGLGSSSPSVPGSSPPPLAQLTPAQLVRPGPGVALPQGPSYPGGAKVCPLNRKRGVGQPRPGALTGAGPCGSTQEGPRWTLLSALLSTHGRPGIVGCWVQIFTRRQTCRTAQRAG